MFFSYNFVEFNFAILRKNRETAIVSDNKVFTDHSHQSKESTQVRALLFFLLQRHILKLPVSYDLPILY